MDNVYEVENGMYKQICHFDEIAYFKILNYGSTMIYVPILRDATQMLGTVGEQGEKILQKYIDYKNRK